MASFLCSTKFLLLVCIVSAVPLGFIIFMERTISSTNSFQYHSNGWLREASKWDDLNRRFLVSFLEGGIGQIPVPEDYTPGMVLKEETVVRESDLAGNASLGIFIDRPRNRLLVVIADVLGNRYGALAAYDLTTWNRLFLTQLSGPGFGVEDGVQDTRDVICNKMADEKAFADDVTMDADGNSYVTDAKGNKIWKVGVDGKFLSVIRSPLFTPKEWYRNIVGLNGIVYHPKGFLLVIHTFSGSLFKIDIEKEEVKLVKVVVGSLTFGDGMELLSPTQLVVAGNPSGRLVESLDNWETAAVLAKYSGPVHRLTTAATVKDGKVYLNHMFGLGLPKGKHVIVEATFPQVKPTSAE